MVNSSFLLFVFAYKLLKKSVAVVFLFPPFRAVIGFVAPIIARPPSRVKGFNHFLIDLSQVLGLS